MLWPRALSAVLSLMLVSESSRGVGGSYAAHRMTTGGASEFSRTARLLPTQLVGLNGSNEVFALAASGLDFDHCMFWQEPFPFPCFDPGRVMHDVQIPPGSDCTATAYAALLANKDLHDFFEAHLQACMHMRNEYARTHARTQKHGNARTQHSRTHSSLAHTHTALGHPSSSARLWADQGHQPKASSHGPSVFLAF